MLTKIREKTQGTFATVILLLIGVPFALWGINNYIDSGREKSVASVGDKEFYQRDVLKAYEQFSRNFQGLGIDEELLKAQALDKLIKDEVLLQYVHARKMVVTDDDVRSFIKALPYFQTDGVFDEGKYKSLLASQRISSPEFVDRIKQGMLMQQFQDGVVNSAFATEYDVERFFNIQNQRRDVDYLTVLLQPVATKPTDEEINAYYQQHKDQFEKPEQVAVEYVQLLLADIAEKVEVTDEKLKAFYEEHKEQFTTPERRKVSHILFLVKDKADDEAALQKARNAKLDLAKKEFAALAAELSDDKATAKQGGDLGLFSAGVMEPAFDKAASTLKLGEVSEPVRSSFGYHLIKVTELVPEKIQSFAEVKEGLVKEYRKSQAETSFYGLAEQLSELSFENPDTLQAVAGALGLQIKKTGLFTADKGDGLAENDKFRSAAFSDEVKQGNNSEAIELDAGNVVALRQVERIPAAAKELSEVKGAINETLLSAKAHALTLEKANQIKASLMSGSNLADLASANKFGLKQAHGLLRQDTNVPAPLLEAVFRAPKPVAGKPSHFVVALPSGEQVVASLTHIVEGVMSEEDKKKMDLALKNIGNSFGQVEFNALINSLKASADIKVNTRPKADE